MIKFLNQLRKKMQSRQISITWKLFLVTAAMFIAFISVWLLFQSLFLEKVYSAVKEKQSVMAIRDFCDRYNSNSWSRSDIDNEIMNMSDLHDVQIVILNEQGNDKYGGTGMVMRDADGNEVSVDLHDVRFIDSLKDSGLEAGAKIRIVGVLNQNGSVMYPYEINVEDCEWKREKNDRREKNDNMVRLEGTVEYLRVMSETEYVDSDSPFLVLKTALKQWQEDNVKLPEQSVIEEYNDTATGIPYKMLIFPFTVKDGSKEAVFAIVPVQPLDEVIKLINDYMGYIFLAALLFVAVLSFIFYRMASKPLIKINEAAIKMSHMDFNTRCDIHTRDELGSLSSSLNIMSAKLNSTITELKDFVSNASHELKTPIAVMGGYLEALGDDIRRDKRDRYIERLKHEVDRMNSLVQDMLELSRMESNPRILNMEAVDLNSLTKAVLDEFVDLLQEKNIGTVVHIERDSAIVTGDYIKLEQVIQNFMSNALRHTACNGTIWITAEKHDGKVTFRIENEGPNIPEEKISKIWDRFYRIEASRNENINGTGLGLAISAKILQLHNAEYGVMNTQRGVMFFFTLEGADLPG